MKRKDKSVFATANKAEGSRHEKQSDINDGEKRLAKDVFKGGARL